MEPSHVHQATGLLTHIADYFEDTGKWSSDALSRYASSNQQDSQLIEYDEDFSNYDTLPDDPEPQSEFDYIVPDEEQVISNQESNFIEEEQDIDVDEQYTQ